MLGLTPLPSFPGAFQGPPMRHQGESVGCFFLGEKAGGEEFTDEDEEVLVLFASRQRVPCRNRWWSPCRISPEPSAVSVRVGGEMTLQIHAAVDGAGRSLSVRLSPGQAADCTHAPALLAGLEAGARVIADRACDSDAILELVTGAGGVAVIPPAANRKGPRELDRSLYARRNLVERFFGTIKEFRRVATRYEKRARNDLSTVLLAETRDLLRTLARRSIEFTRQANRA